MDQKVFISQPLGQWWVTEETETLSRIGQDKKNRLKMERKTHFPSEHLDINSWLGICMLDWLNE